MSWGRYANALNNPAAGASSMPPLGSQARTSTSPSRMPGARPRNSACNSALLPAPVHPAMRVCAPPDTARHQRSPSSVTPTGTASRSTRSGTGPGATVVSRRSSRPRLRVR